MSSSAPTIEAQEELIDYTIVDLDDLLYDIDDANRSQLHTQEVEHNSAKQCLLVCTEIKRNMEMLGPKERVAPLVTISGRAVKLTSDDPARYKHERRIWKNIEAIAEDFVAKSGSVDLDSVLEDLNKTQVIVQRVEVRF